jgi:hypothetical protein
MPRQRALQSAQDRSDDRGFPVQVQQAYDVPSRFGLGTGLVASDPPAAVAAYLHSAPGSGHESATAAHAVGLGQAHADTAILHVGRHRPFAEWEFDRFGEGHLAVTVGTPCVFCAAAARCRCPPWRFGLPRRRRLPRLVHSGGGSCGRCRSSAGGGPDSGGVRARRRGIGGRFRVGAAAGHGQDQ